MGSPLSPVMPNIYLYGAFWTQSVGQHSFKTSFVSVICGGHVYCMVPWAGYFGWILRHLNGYRIQLTMEVEGAEGLLFLDVLVHHSGDGALGRRVPTHTDLLFKWGESPSCDTETSCSFHPYSRAQVVLDVQHLAGELNCFAFGFPA